MDKTTIEYINKNRRKREKKNEIKNELIKKIRYSSWMEKNMKDDLINKILVEFAENENREKAWNVFEEISKQNETNREKRENLLAELNKINLEIQKEKRRYAMQKKILINEDFSWVDEYSIKRKKKKRDETKSKVEKYDIALKKLKEKKIKIEEEISGLEIYDIKKKVHNSRKSLKNIDSKYKNYSINELLKQDIWLSKYLKNKIKTEISKKRTPDNRPQTGNWFLNLVKIICIGSIIVTAMSWLLAPFFTDGCELLVIFWTIIWLRIYITFKRHKNLEKYQEKPFKDIKSVWGVITVVIIYIYIIFIFKIYNESWH